MATPPVAPGVRNQQVGGFERIERMPAPPRPMQPRPSLVVGGPAFFTPEGYQAPVQPEQAFMPTDRRPDPIGDNFRRPYERPIMPMPSPTPPPEMAQPAPPRVPIEQPIKEPVIDPGPIETLPVMPMPIPEPQPKYDPFAYSDLGQRALGGEYIDSMTFHYFDPTTGKSGSTTEGYSRVPDSAKPYIYLDKGEAEEAKKRFMTYEDRGDVDTTPRRTPVTAPAPAPATTMPDSGRDELGDYMIVGGKKMRFTTQPITIPEGNVFTDMRARGLSEAKLAVEPDSYFPMPSPMQPITLPNGQTVQIPDFDMSRTVPQPTMPSIPSLPKLGSRPSLRRMPMMDDPRER